MCAGKHQSIAFGSVLRFGHGEGFLIVCFRPLQATQMFRDSPQAAQRDGHLRRIGIESQGPFVEGLRVCQVSCTHRVAEIDADRHQRHMVGSIEAFRLGQCTGEVQPRRADLMPLSQTHAMRCSILAMSSPSISSALCARVSAR